jgi:hypothetical protein
MTLTVRLPHRVEQQLAEYCVKRKLTKSEAVKQALDGLLRAPVETARHPFIGGDQGDGSDVSGNVKAALRARFRSTDATAGSAGKRAR